MSTPTPKPADLHAASSSRLAPAWRARLKRAVCWLGLALVASYFLLCWALLNGGDRYFTFRPVTGRTLPEAVRLTGVRERIISTPDGERLIAWRAAARPGQPTLLYFHGNGDALTYRAGRIASFQAEGYGVFMIAYRGYSGSSGRPSEAAFVSDAKLAYALLRQDGIEPRDIVIYGESLGTSVAVQVAVDAPSLAVILEAPFTSMIEAWQQFVPHVPVRLLLRDRFETDRVIARLRAPLLVMHGERDRLVGFRLGERLFSLAPEPKRFEAFPDASHTNLYGFNAVAAVRRFIDDVRAGRMPSN